MMTNKFSTTRRHVLTGGAALAAIPLAAMPMMAAAPAFAGNGTKLSTIAKLWAQAEALRMEMRASAPQIAAAHARTGLPGWMHVAGRANNLGHRRYDVLVGMLKSRATSKDDLALIALATNDHDMQHGPKSWAHSQFDRAARDYHVSAAA